MLRVASALELWFEIVGLNSAVLGNQSRQSLSEQKIELSAQRNSLSRKARFYRLR